MNKKYLLIFVAFLWSGMSLFAQQLSSEELKKGRWLSQEEYDNRSNVGKFFQPSEAPEGPINPVAEFEPMEAVLIAYPFGIPMELIVEMSNVVKVTTLVHSTSQQNSVTTQYENAGVNMDNVDFMVEPHNTYWTRDYGPWFIREEDQVSIVNFTYNRPRPDDDIIPAKIADIYGAAVYNMPVVHTGGNYMCDGFGIAAQTELVYEENSISDAQVDAYMEEYLGVTDNFVVTDPLDDYIMHIDCWGKFLDVDKVLVSQVPESDYRYEDYEAAANYFATRNCAYGYPFEVIRVYAPGNYPYTPYTNSLILNNTVFLPITGSTHDATAIATYEEAMPGYNIVTVMAGSDGWLNSDALHCRTHEIADFGMLKITHIPAFHGEVEVQSAYTIEAKIHPYSNESLYADSLLVYYQINGGAFQFMTMTDNGEEMFSADIIASEGDEVAYYIHAADESGRSENMPYIGAPDPFVFTVSGEAVSENITFTPDTLFVHETEEHVIIINNTGDGPAAITNIVRGETGSPLWWINHTVPEITSYPYELLPSESIEVYLDVAVGKAIFYDSLIVTTEANNYHSIVASDGVGVNDEFDSKEYFVIAPNPINNHGTISLVLEEPAAVQLEIFHINGQLIQRLEDSRLSSGSYQYNWDGRNSQGSEMENGVYLVRLQKNGEVTIQKWIKM
ncbi:T9SS type A sorting domain-containing protein [Lentimicrobium sp. L6]|uniref:agmatine deiminase family protein n=1 Tax=Lentimicrobium sp. L6 TaxID=2735916 RepID=UPI0015538259|nr:agmatine deiminase family protein [Lentimicrobium sp. L6]NPD83967.1 T9SS type A sorting domain-containing protein [Lentimicrobium sp. L6]